ncbi:DUF72 domain-containing protein [Paracoccus sp. PS-1]|uniref:DUF72 domain-containing protein n=1 Tax=unclassified Paracoccus (in: a-proteobacteria) TaxID=2688777 RepID=UPI00048C5AC2|nr:MULTISPECIES: DUF72 domain-containing protein [unclassified Paracoccus (in: a-proteobacteria)]MDQ7261536.1 DUF72 domain-containing protein [Paracoccus sp. PS1]UFM64719.1 DUF72 domain-containing protein [Paracoccus sp. MA]
MDKKGMGRIRIGIGGWTYEPWRGSFYPEGLPQRRELEHASRQLSSIEINGTYYGAQKPESFRKWHDETPEDFVFSVKAPRYATNRKVLAEAGETIARFFSGGVMLLGDKLGPINWQFMATKKFDPADFEAFLKLLPASVEGRALRHVVEVRHDSFRCPEFPALLREHGVAAAVAADGKFPQIADPTAPFVYARIMGTTEDEPLGYSKAALDLWAERARIWALGGLPEGLDYAGPNAAAGPRDVYLYVISGHKMRNPQAAMALIERLG